MWSGLMPGLLDLIVVGVAVVAIFAIVVFVFTR